MDDTTLSSLDNWDHHIFSSKLGVDRFKNIIIDAGLNRTFKMLHVLESKERFCNAVALVALIDISLQSN